MKPADEHNTPDAIIALLDGALAPADADRVRAQIENDPAATEESAVWRALFDDLHAIGDAVTASAPTIDIWSAIENRLDSAVDAEETWTFDQLLDLAEGRLEQRAAVNLRNEMERSAVLKQHFAWVVSVRDELGALGDSIANTSPSVDLLPSILQSLAAGADHPEAEDLFTSLLEWRDGVLPLPESDRLRRMADTSADIHTANDWIQEAADELESLGDQLVANAPEIDVSRAVMDAVYRIADPDPIVTLDAERLRRRAQWRLVGSVAAAALIALAIGAVWFASGNDATQTTPPEAPVLANPEPAWQQDEYIEKRQQLPQRPKRRMYADLRNPAGIDEPRALAGTQAPLLDALDTDTVLAARKKAAQTGDWSEFQQLAALTPEEAQELAKKPGLPATALVGLADSLMPSDKEKALLTVVGILPGSPYIQLELLESVAEQPPGDAQSEEPLRISQRISELDPQNALPYYLEAKMYLDNGDPRSAIAVLLEAQALDYANAYSLEAAAHRRSALIANGMAPETAELLAAFDAGNEQADALFNLAVDLLDYGNYYNGINDFETARIIFEGVQTLGNQIEAGAVLSQEQLVALDIQSAAIDVLGQFYETQGIVEALRPLTEQSLNIMADLDSLNVFFVQLNTMLGDVLSPTFWNDVAGVFMTEGDLAILNYLTDWGLLPESP